MARENPEPAVWVALAIGAVAATAVVVYVATRPSSTVLTGPAITPGQSVSTLNNAANTAATAQAAEAAAAAATVAAKAAADAALLNTTYQLVVSGNQNIQLKVGDTVHFIPSMNGSPPVATQWTYTPDTSNANSVIIELGSTNGADESYQAMGVGSTNIIVKNADAATGQTVFATYVVGITVVAA